MQKIRISLSEEASEILLYLMKQHGHTSPTHTANVVITKFKDLLSPSEEKHNDQRSNENH